MIKYSSEGCNYLTNTANILFILDSVPTDNTKSDETDQINIGVIRLLQQIYNHKDNATCKSEAMVLWQFRNETEPN